MRMWITFYYPPLPYVTIKQTFFMYEEDLQEEDIATRENTVHSQKNWIIGEEKEQSVQLALSGRVPVTVTLENGAITPGDPITSSDISGVGMKAKKRGPIVGKALTSLNNQSPELFACTNPQTGETYLCGTVTVLVNVSWFDPAFALQDTVRIENDGSLHVQEVVADTGRFRTICIGSTCIDEEELEKLKD